MLIDICSRRLKIELLSFGFPFSVQERDLDLLILEQLHVSIAFVGWLVARLKLLGAKFHSAQHSIYRWQGETDVLLFLDTIEGRLAVMIEDKSVPYNRQSRTGYMIAPATVDVRGRLEDAAGRFQSMASEAHRRVAAHVLAL